MNSIDENPEIVEIKDSLEKRFNFIYYSIVYLLVYVNSFLLAVGITSIFVFEDIFGLVVFLALAVIMDTAFFVAIHGLNSNLKPILRVKIVISEERIEIFVQNHSFREYLWREIEKIMIATETYAWMEKRFRIDMNGKYWQKHIRPDVFHLNKENTRKLIQSLKEYSTRLDKEYIVIAQREKGDWEEFQKEVDEIENFRRKFKKKKKPVKYTSYERRFRFVLETESGND